MPAQYLSTSRLANVIQLIALGRQTGILRAVRHHGASREMGQIQFVDGQPMAALLGHLTGTAAINVLSNWGETSYMFDEAIVGDDASLDANENDQTGAAESAPYGAWPSGDAAWGRHPSGASGASGSPGAPGWPSAPGAPAWSPAPGMPGGSGSFPSNSPSTSPSWPSYGSPPSGPYPARPAPPSSLPNSRPPYGSMPGAGFSQPGATSSLPSGAFPSVPGSAVGAQSPLPRRTSQVDLTDPLPLDRRERMVLLLVDGKRSVSDLSRLTRRTDDEVRAVLGNLKMLGLIE